MSKPYSLLITVHYRNEPLLLSTTTVSNSLNIDVIISSYPREAAQVFKVDVIRRQAIINIG